MKKLAVVLGGNIREFGLFLLNPLRKRQTSLGVTDKARRFLDLLAFLTVLDILIYFPKEHIEHLAHIARMLQLWKMRRWPAFFLDCF